MMNSEEDSVESFEKIYSGGFVSFKTARVGRRKKSWRKQ
jgi:hypothetical protein